MAEIALVYKIDEDYKIETVLAESVKGYYQIKSVPAFAQNIAYDDIIDAKAEDGVLYFEALITPSGHSTLHIVMFKSAALNEIVSGIEFFGLKPDYMGNKKYLFVDIPTTIPYKTLRGFLLKHFELGNMDFKEACLSKEHRIMIGVE